MLPAQMPTLPPRKNLRPTCSNAELPPLSSARMLDQLRKRLRLMHYSLRTEEAYVYCVKAFIRFHRPQHPASLGGPKVEAFLTYLADGRSVARRHTARHCRPCRFSTARCWATSCSGCRRLGTRSGTAACPPYWASMRCGSCLSDSPANTCCWLG